MEIRLRKPLGATLREIKARWAEFAGRHGSDAHISAVSEERGGLRQPVHEHLPGLLNPAPRDFI